MTEKLSEASLAPDKGAVIPRVRNSEIGITGLKKANKRIIDEANRAFQFPAYLKLLDEMRNNPTVGAGLNIYRMMLGKVEWTVEPPLGASDVQKDRAKFIASLMDDMEHSWASFLTEVETYLEFGFCVSEKVFRRRLKQNGSKYNDGRVGIRKLPIRSQATICGWLYSEDGRELIGVEQSLANVVDANRYVALTKNGTTIKIPREKFLHFRADATKDNPEGRSILKSCYLAYKQLQLIQEQELLGLSRDLQGIPVIGLPAEWMDLSKATDAQTASVTAFTNMADGLSTGNQASVIIPLLYDESTKNPLVTFDLLESKGGKNYDTSAIIQRLQNDILTSLSCDVVRLGGNSGDSFSLAETKTNLLSLALAYRLKEIKEVLNNDLIPAIFAANGWEDTDLPKFATSDFDNVSLEEFSKYLQRVKSVGLLELDREVMNKVRTTMGVSPRPADEPVNEDDMLLGQEADVSKSGKSFNSDTGGQNGTSNKVSGKDKSVDNPDNSA